MKFNGQWYESAEGSALSQASESIAIRNMQAMIGEKLKGLESYDVNPQAIEDAINKTVEEIANSRPEIKVLGSHQEGDLFIIDVEVPLTMAHLFDSYPRV